VILPDRIAFVAAYHTSGPHGFKRRSQ
jgi:hypothetical protein